MQFVVNLIIHQVQANFFLSHFRQLTARFHLLSLHPLCQSDVLQDHFHCCICKLHVSRNRIIRRNTGQDIDFILLTWRSFYHDFIYLDTFSCLAVKPVGLR